MEFVLDNGSVRIALSTAGGSFTSITANGREYLWQGDPAVWSGMNHRMRKLMEEAKEL